MSIDDSSDFYILNYIDNIPKNYAEYYLESRSVSGFSSNFIDEIQDLLKQITLLEAAIEEIRVFVSKQNLCFTRRKSLIHSVKQENEELREIIKSNESLNSEYKKMIEREAENRTMLCNKLMEKENEISDYLNVIEGMNKKIINYEQMRKLQNNHISLLQESVVNSENNNLNNNTNAYLSNTPLLRRMNRDIDLMTIEKIQLENTLSIKTNEFTLLEKRYLKLQRKNEVLLTENNLLESKICENDKENQNLKNKLKNLQKSLKFMVQTREKNTSNSFEKSINPTRKSKSLIISTQINKEEKTLNLSPQRKTLFEDFPPFTLLSPRVSTYQLDFSKEDIVSNSSHNNGHIHQESFGLQGNLNLTHAVYVENHNDKEESPKFAKSDESSVSTFIAKNPNAQSKSSTSNEELLIPNPVNINIINNNNMDKNRAILNIFFHKTPDLDSMDETRKKLIEIEMKAYNKDNSNKKSQIFQMNENHPKLKNMSKMQEILKFTLRMIPTGTFFTKMMDISEDLFNK